MAGLESGKPDLDRFGRFGLDEVAASGEYLRERGDRMMFGHYPDGDVYEIDLAVVPRPGQGDELMSADRTGPHSTAGKSARHPHTCSMSDFGR